MENVNSNSDICEQRAKENSLEEKTAVVLAKPSLLYILFSVLFFFFFKFYFRKIQFLNEAVKLRCVFKAITVRSIKYWFGFIFNLTAYQHIMTYFMLIPNSFGNI